MDHWKYVESGLWDGHFRDAASREGLVLRSEAMGLTQPPGRFGTPLQPRWPFQNAKSGRSAGCGEEVHSKPGSKAAQKRAELRSCPLQPGKSDEARCRVPVLAVQVLVPVLVAIVVARLIKCPDASSVEELAMLRAEVAAQIASLEEAAHQAKGLAVDEDATGELPN
eukprot:s1406_g12.t1